MEVPQIHLRSEILSIFFFSLQMEAALEEEVPTFDLAALLQLVEAIRLEISQKFPNASNVHLGRLGLVAHWLRKMDILHKCVESTATCIIALDRSRIFLHDAQKCLDALSVLEISNKFTTELEGQLWMHAGVMYHKEGDTERAFRYALN